MLTRLAERVIARRVGLAPATNQYRVTRAMTVPMRDGVTLLADHYAPVTSTPAGTLLLRGPYKRDAAPTRLMMGLHAVRGCHVVLQSTRGSFGSGGVFEPGYGEADDGVDTVDWLRRQPWFTGTFATVGSSYLGFTQWAVMANPTPELTAAVVTMGPHDLGKKAWGTGSFALSGYMTWGYGTPGTGVGDSPPARPVGAHPAAAAARLRAIAPSRRRGRRSGRGLGVLRKLVGPH